MKDSLDVVKGLLERAVVATELLMQAVDGLKDKDVFHRLLWVIAIRIHDDVGGALSVIGHYAKQAGDTK